MSQENEHVEGDQVEASRPVFKSNTEMLQYMHDQWSDDNAYVDLLQRTARRRNAAAHFVQPSLSGEDVLPKRSITKVFITTSYDDHLQSVQRLSRWRRGLAWLRDMRPARSTVITPPGAMLMSLSRVFFGPSAHEEVFSQIVADMREEYFDALGRGARVEAWVTRVRWTWAWAKAAGQKLPLDWFKKLVGIATTLLGGA